MTALSPSSSAADVIAFLRTQASTEVRDGKKHYGISVERALGVKQPVKREIARAIKKNHTRAIELWQSGIADAQFVAAFTADPKLMTLELAQEWANDFDSWDLVDGVSGLFVEMAQWRELIAIFASDEREYVRRAAFAMLNWAAVHRKKEPDETLIAYLPLIEEHATDPRNFVKKAVNWALRGIGKRSLALHGPALQLAEKLAASSDKTARWIGADAVRELSDEKTISMIVNRKS